MGGSDSKPEVKIVEKVVYKEPPPPKFIPCWRTMSWGCRESLKSELRQFSSGREDIPLINIAVFGLVGSGKSSFCNTLDSTFKGRVAAKAATGSVPGSLTKKFQKYRPGGRNGPPCYLCDTMGMEEDQGLDIVDIPYILDGNIPDKFEFYVGKHVTPSSPGFIRCPTVAEQMHVVCYVVNACKVNLSSSETIRKIHKIKSAANDRDIRFMILLTNIDGLCPGVKDNVQNAYRSFVVDKIVKEISEISGLPISFIYVIKNYSSEAECNADIDVLGLSALKQILYFAEDAIEDL